MAIGNQAVVDEEDGQPNLASLIIKDNMVGDFSNTWDVNADILALSTYTATGGDAWIYGIESNQTITNSSIGHVYDFAGIGTNPTNYGSGNIDRIKGIQLSARQRGNGTIQDMYGVDSRVISTSNSGAISNAYGIYSHGFFESPLTNYYGLYSGLESYNSAPVTNAYGLYLDTVQRTGVVNSWQLYSAGNSPSYFAGNVGIGTTSPTNKLTITDATNPQLSLSAGGGLAQWTFRNAGGNFYLSTTTVSGTATTSTSALSILNNGNVGIGNDQPVATLQIGPTAYDPYGYFSPYSNLLLTNPDGNRTDITLRDAGSYGGLRFYTSNGTNGSPTTLGAHDTLGILDFEGYDGTFYSQNAYIIAKNDGAINKGRFDFNTSDGLSYARTRLSITSSGNVGIGSTSPASTLAVEGNSQITGKILVGPDESTLPSQMWGYTGGTNLITSNVSAINNNSALGVEAVGNYYTMYGIYSLLYGEGTGIQGDARLPSTSVGQGATGLYGLAATEGRASILYGIQTSIAVLTNAQASSSVGFIVNTPYKASGAILDDAYGILVANQNGSTNNYSIYTNQSSGTNNYSLYNAGSAKSYFAGNLGLGTTTPTLGRLVVEPGAYVSAGGVWTNASDKNQKENFTVVSPEETLSKINQLPITQWNYKTEDKSVKHIGPVAQDFYSLFNLGNNDTSISTIDPSGVALLGIQALSKRFDSLFSTSTSTSSPLSLIAIGGKDILDSLGYYSGQIVDGVIHFARVTVDTLTAKSGVFERVCIKKSDGTPVCLTGDELSSVLEKTNTTVSGQSGGGASTVSDPGNSTQTDNTADTATSTPEVISTETATSTTPTDSSLSTTTVDQSISTATASTTSSN
jgi:hypothetical protein